MSVGFVYCHNCQGVAMSLLFEQFGVRRVELDVLMWPGFSHGFKKGQLSALYGALNTDDLFESCELRATIGAEFESEHWSYDISTTRVRVASEAFASFEELDRTVLHLLEETKGFFTPRRLPFLTADRAYVLGVIPEDTSKDIGDVLRSKILARKLSTTEEGAGLNLLPGDVAGIGLEFVGDTEDYHWHAKVGPSHQDNRTLPLSAELYFSPPSETPQESMISDSLATAYQFLTESVLAFAQNSLG